MLQKPYIRTCKHRSIRSNAIQLPPHIPHLPQVRLHPIQMCGPYVLLDEFFFWICFELDLAIPVLAHCAIVKHVEVLGGRGDIKAFVYASPPARGVGYLGWKTLEKARELDVRELRLGVTVMKK